VNQIIPEHSLGKAMNLFTSLSVGTTTVIIFDSVSFSAEGIEIVGAYCLFSFEVGGSSNGWRIFFQGTDVQKL